jgi:hypothetical protein
MNAPSQDEERALRVEKHSIVFLALENSLRDAVVLTSILDTIVQGIDSLSGLSKRQLEVVYEQLDMVTTTLKKAVDQLDDTYHERTKKEAA